MDLNYLPERIKAHKLALVNIVTPPVCTERAEAYTRAYQANEDKPVIVQRALALQEQALEELLARAENGLRNDYEIYWLQAQLEDTRQRLGDAAPR